MSLVILSKALIVQLGASISEKLKSSFWPGLVDTCPRDEIQHHLYCSCFLELGCHWVLASLRKNIEGHTQLFLLTQTLWKCYEWISQIQKTIEPSVLYIPRLSPQICGWDSGPTSLVVKERSQHYFLWSQGESCISGGIGWSSYLTQEQFQSCGLVQGADLTLSNGWWAQNP